MLAGALLALLVPLVPAAPMPAPTLGAAERLLAAVKAHPLALVVPPDDLRAGEAVARLAMAQGLTPAQVVDVRAGLDTPEERAHVASLLAGLIDDQDAILLLLWLRDECALVPTAPPVVVAAGPPWRERLTRPLLFYSAPNYYWSKATAAQVDATLNAILARGLDGISVEYGGTFISDEYRKIPNGAGVASLYAEQSDRWALWDAGLRRRGLIAHVAFLNANQSKANTISDSQWESIAKTWAQRYGPDNKLVLPLSESDSRTRSSIGNAIHRGLMAGGYPRSQLISMAGRWGDWTETHHGRGKVPSGNFRTIVVNDNGPSIADLYGSSWTSGGTPNLGRIQEYSAEIRRKGVSGAVYSFGQAFDFAGLQAAAAGWGGQAPVVVSTADAVPVSQIDAPSNERAALGWPIVTQIKAVERAGRGAVRFTYDPRPTGWAKQSNAKGLDGNLWYGLRQPNGRWKMATWEYTVITDRARDTRDLEELGAWPSGTEVLFMLSSICRNGQRTSTQARSQIYLWRVP